MADCITPGCLNEVMAYGEDNQVCEYCEAKFYAQAALFRAIREFGQAWGDSKLLDVLVDAVHELSTTTEETTDGKV